MKSRRGLTLRSADYGDERFLYELRNEKEVRRNSFCTEPISYEQHVVWFQKKMRDADTRIYILSHDGMSVGQVRADISDCQAKISYALCKEARGKGYAKWMLTELERILEEEEVCRGLLAEVKEENHVSCHIFRSLGYEEKRVSTGYCFRKNLHTV